MQRNQKITINGRIQNLNQVCKTTADNAYIASQVEGRVEVWIAEQCFFVEENLLLIEFAQYLNSWLEKITSSGLIEPFYYVSMDYEESPILEVYSKDKGQYFVSSVWVSQPVEISIKFWSDAAKTFLTDLESQLAKLGIELKPFLFCFNKEQ